MRSPRTPPRRGVRDLDLGHPERKPLARTSIKEQLINLGCFFERATNDREGGIGSITAALAVSYVVSWWIGWRAVRAVAEAKLATQPSRPPKRLGLDETAFRRPLRFMTGLVNHDTRRGRLSQDFLGAAIDPFAGYKGRRHRTRPTSASNR